MYMGIDPPDNSDNEFFEEEEPEEIDDPFNLFEGKFREGELDAGYDRGKWGEGSPLSMDDMLSSLASEDYDVSHVKGWICFTPKHSREIHTAHQFYERLLFYVHQHDCQELYVVYDSTDTMKLLVKKRGVLLPLRSIKIPESTPRFLEDTLSEIYETEVRELDSGEELTETFVFHHATREEILGAITTYLSRIPVNNGTCYRIKIESKAGTQPSEIQNH
jgi:hypothetical protein